MLNIRKKISFPLLLLLLATTAMREYLQWVLFLFLFLWYILANLKHFAILKMPGGRYLFFLILQCFLFGAFFYTPNVRGYWSFIRDVIIITNMALCWFVANIFINRLRLDTLTVYRTILLFAFIMSVRSIVLRFASSSSNFSAFVENGAINGFTVSISLYLILFKPPIVKRFYFGKIEDRIIEMFIILAFLFSFSRTTLLILGCLILFGKYDSISAYAKTILVIAIGIFVLSYFTPEVLDTFLNKIVRSIIEVSSSNTWDDYNVVMNWRGYEVHMAKLAFEKYSLLEKLFGRGFGATVDVGQYAYLVTSEDSLPFLHNGYYTTLIKGGIIGVLLTAGYYFSAMGYYVKLSIPKYEKRLAIGIIAAMAVSMTVIHGFFWGGAQLLVFYILGIVEKGEQL